jgi:hypothetical protein
MAKFARARSQYSCEAFSGVECVSEAVTPTTVVEPRSKETYCFFESKSAPDRDRPKASEVHHLDRCMRHILGSFEYPQKEYPWAGQISPRLSWRVVTEEAYYCLTARRLLGMGDCLTTRLVDGYVDAKFTLYAGARACRDKVVVDAPLPDKLRFIEQGNEHFHTETMGALRLPTAEETATYFGGDTKTFRLMVERDN